MDNKLARDKAWQQAFAELYKAEPGMWDDVQKLYEGYFAYDPKAVADRIEYAQTALTANHLDIAVEQMLLVSANADPALSALIWHSEPRSSIAAALNARIIHKEATGDAKDALADLRRICKLARPAHPQQWYFHLWIWMVQTELGQKAQADRELADFVKSRPPVAPTDWPPKIAAFFLGHVSEGDFLAAADASDPKERTGDQCEAWFYAGKKRLIAGDTKTAAEDFRKCAATNQTDFAEYQTALIELQSLEK